MEDTIGAAELSTDDLNFTLKKIDSQTGIDRLSMICRRNL